MKAGRNRFRRQDHPRLRRANGGHPRRAHFLAALSIAVLLALATATAQAETGGASTAAAGDAQAGRGLAFSPMRWAAATWYGPGLYGNRTACGQVLRPHTVGVAHRNLPCGTTVKLVYHGHQLLTSVIDRGPYSRGNSWDLTNGARRALRFGGSGRIGYAVSLGYARNFYSGLYAAR